MTPKTPDCWKHFFGQMVPVGARRPLSRLRLTRPTHMSSPQANWAFFGWKVGRVETCGNKAVVMVVMFFVCLSVCLVVYLFVCFILCFHGVLWWFFKGLVVLYGGFLGRFGWWFFKLFASVRGEIPHGVSESVRGSSPGVSEKLKLLFFFRAEVTAVGLESFLFSPDSCSLIFFPKIFAFTQDGRKQGAKSRAHSFYPNTFTIRNQPTRSDPGDSEVSATL